MRKRERESAVAGALKGAVAGVTGTAAMTMAMRRVLPALLPRPARREFLPGRVVAGLERRLTGRHRLDPAERRVVAMPAHYAYGTAAGMGYGLLRSRFRDAPPGLLGTAWGLAIWALSYEGWLPAAGIAPATTERPPRQWVVPIVAHMVYGLATAYAWEAASAEAR